MARTDRELPWVSPARDWHDRLPSPFEPRVAFRWRLRDHRGAPVPSAVALVDAAVPVLAALRRGETVPELDRRRFARALRASAFHDRQRRSPYSRGSDDLGDTERLAVSAAGALRVAAVLLELRDVRFCDR
jgi:hypothetical protein